MKRKRKCGDKKLHVGSPIFDLPSGYKYWRRVRKELMDKMKIINLLINRDWSKDRKECDGENYGYLQKPT